MVFTGLQTFRQPEGRRKEESNERAFFCVAILAFFPLQSSKRSHSVAPKPCDALSVAYASSSFVRAFLARRAITPSSSVCREGHCRPFQHSACFASLPFPRCLSSSSASYISALFIQRITGALTCRCLAGRGQGRGRPLAFPPSGRLEPREGGPRESATLTILDRRKKQPFFPPRRRPTYMHPREQSTLALSVPMVFNSCFSDRHNLLFSVSLILSLAGVPVNGVPPSQIVCPSYDLPLSLPYFSPCPDFSPIKRGKREEERIDCRTSADGAWHS